MSGAHRNLKVHGACASVKRPGLDVDALVLEPCGQRDPDQPERQAGRKGLEDDGSDPPGTERGTKTSGRAHPGANGTVAALGHSCGVFTIAQKTRSVAFGSFPSIRTIDAIWPRWYEA